MSPEVAMQPDRDLRIRIMRQDAGRFQIEVPDGGNWAPFLAGLYATEVRDVVTALKGVEIVEDQREGFIR